MAKPTILVTGQNPPSLQPQPTLKRRIGVFIPLAGDIWWESKQSPGNPPITFFNSSSIKLVRTASHPYQSKIQICNEGNAKYASILFYLFKGWMKAL